MPKKGIKIAQSITDKQDASLGLYFRDVSRIPRLTHEEEIEYSKKAKQGDRIAREKLINSNLRFAISVAKHYQGKGLPLIDLIQAANCGLIESVDHYDPDKGYKFISFAVWWIRQSVIKALSDNCRTVRIPISQLSCVGQVNKAVEAFEQKYGRTPTEHELATETSLSLDKIQISSIANLRTMSLDTPFKDEDASCLLDVIPNENSAFADVEVHSQDRTSEIEKALAQLPCRESDIIRMSFGLGIISMTCEQIASYFGVGAERIRQLQKKALKLLRENFGEDLRALL